MKIIPVELQSIVSKSEIYSGKASKIIKIIRYKIIKI